MGWRTGVRKISIDVLNKILSVALVDHNRTKVKAPSVNTVQILQSDALELLIKRPRSKTSGSLNQSRIPRLGTKKIGDWAEELVYRWLCENLNPGERDTVDWVAQRGETPGWDISYLSATGDQVYVEVKATTSNRFYAIEITGNEWRAAELQGENYILIFHKLTSYLQ